MEIRTKVFYLLARSSLVMVWDLSEAKGGLVIAIALGIMDAKSE
jgi:hypothetical protein